MVIQRLPPRGDDYVPRTTGALSLVLVLVVVIAVWLLNGRDPGTGTSGDPVGSTSSPASTTASASGPAAVGNGPAPAPTSTDPDSGLPVVALADLPPQASDTVDLIDAGPPYPYAADGSTFGNFEGILPGHERGYYEEFTVLTPGSEDRGARRIVAGDQGELYWTQDHYGSFERIHR